MLSSQFSPSCQNSTNWKQRKFNVNNVFTPRKLDKVKVNVEQEMSHEQLSELRICPRIHCKCDWDIKSGKSFECIFVWKQGYYSSSKYRPTWLITHREQWKWSQDGKWHRQNAPPPQDANEKQRWSGWRHGPMAASKHVSACRVKVRIKGFK